jgi:hypothetical protein
MKIIHIIFAILFILGCMIIQSCAGSSSLPYRDAEIGMTKGEIVKKLNTPNEIREPVVNAFGQTIDVWEYEHNRFYFLSDTIVMKEYSNETWTEAKEKIYRTEFRSATDQAINENKSEVFRIGLGAGGGVTAPVCEECRESAWMGQLSGRARVMIRINDQWWVGAEPFFSGKGSDVYETHDDDWRSNNTYWSHLMLVANYYPTRKFFFEVGGGVSIYNSYDQHVSTRPDYPTVVHGEGFGIITGIGYDIRISKDFVITPTVSYFHAFLKDLDLNISRIIYNKRALKEFDASVTICFTPRM